MGWSCSAAEGRRSIQGHVKQELARKSSTWTACVLSDMEALNIGGVVALEREANNRESFRTLTSAYTQI
jgi:hypothetical protein